MRFRILRIIFGILDIKKNDACGISRCYLTHILLYETYIIIITSLKFNLP